MPRFLRSPLEVERAIAADTQYTLDLPVNPLAAIIITLDVLDGLAVTATRGNAFYQCQHITNVDVQFKGSSIINGSLQDLAMLSALFGNRLPQQDTRPDAATARDRFSVVIPFGRKLYWGKEAFPATRRGEFKLLITPDDVVGTSDVQTIHVETIELLDATPEQFIKATTITRTPTATGDSDADFPLGNPIIGALLFGTTAPNAAAITASMRRVKLLIDNTEQFYNDTRWASLHSDLLDRLFGYSAPTEHIHEENLAAAYAANVSTDPGFTGINTFTAAGPRQYAYLDFDPLGDDSYLLDTEGRGRVHLRINADVADAQRILPVELIRLPGAGG